MDQIERFIIGALAAGVWSLVALQVTSISQTYAQETSVIDQVEGNSDTQKSISVIHARDIVGLNALIDKIVSDRRLRPETMPGLDQYVKSIVRRCRVSGTVTGDQITSTNISC